MRTDNEEIREAVADEMLRFMRHMQGTMIFGTPVEQWIRDGVNWYCAGERDDDTA